MPIKLQRNRDHQTNNSLLAAWIAAEDHFGAKPAHGLVPQQATPSRPPPSSQPGASLQESPVARQSTSSRPVTDATFGSTERETSVVTSSTQPTSPPAQLASVSSSSPRFPNPAPPDSSAPPSPPTSPSRAPSSAPSQPQRTSVRRTRSQVVRDSYDILWREYLALTATDQQQHQPASAARRTQSLSYGASTSTATTTVARSYLDGARSITRSPVAMPSAPPPPPDTIMQGPLPYDKPKGLSALLVPVLCPPTDILDLQRLTKLLVALFVRVAALVVMLSFILVPAWLWLVRHELLIGHQSDAAAVALAGLLAFLTADAIKRASTASSAARHSGIFNADTKGAYQVAPGLYTFAAATAAGNAKPAGAIHPHRPPPPPPVGAATANTAGAVPGASSRGVAAHGVAANGTAVASSTDPMVRQVKQRIMKLEKLLFGNELTEADISRDALHSRVQMLCTEVGVPFGGPGGSSAKPTAAELDEQLKAVELALGVQ